MNPLQSAGESNGSPLRILRCIRSMSRAYGGPVEGILGFSRIERNYNVQSEIVSVDSPNDSTVADDVVKLHRVGPGLGGYGFTLKLTRWLRANIRSYDIVIIHGIFEFHTIAAALECARAGIPYVIFTHGMLDPWFARTFPFKHRKKQVYWKVVLGGVFDRASAVFFTAAQERILAAESFPINGRRSEVVPYGISDPIPKIRHLTEENSEQKLKIILCLGRIDQKKACDLLIQAFARICKSETLTQDWSLIIAGPCKDLEYLSTLNRLAGTGRIIVDDRLIVGDEKWRTILGCSIYALPSHQENFGIAIAEALACGKPVIVSDKVNIWEDIQHAGAGFVCEDTVDSISAILETALRTPAHTLRKIGESARKLFLEKFEVSQSVRAQAIILRRIVDTQNNK